MASKAKGVARRENIITALLLIAGALLALALFAAGALWRGKSSAPRQKTSILTPEGKTDCPSRKFRFDLRNVVSASDPHQTRAQPIGSRALQRSERLDDSLPESS